MGCGCNEFQGQGSQYCQDCMPDELQWLVPMESVPDPFLMDRHHAYITSDNSVYVLSKDRTQAVKINGSGNGAIIDTSKLALKTDIVTYKAGDGVVISDNTISASKDLLDTKSDLSNINKRVTTLENKEDKDTIYDDTELTKRVKALEDRKVNLNVKTLKVNDIAGYNYNQSAIENAKALAPYVSNVNFKRDAYKTTSTDLDYELVLKDDTLYLQPMKQLEAKVIGYEDTYGAYPLSSYTHTWYNNVTINTTYRGNIYILWRKNNTILNTDVTLVDKVEYDSNFAIFVVRVTKDTTRIDFKTT